MKIDRYRHPTNGSFAIVAINAGPTTASIRFSSSFLLLLSSIFFSLLIFRFIFCYFIFFYFICLFFDFFVAVSFSLVGNNFIGVRSLTPYSTSILRCGERRGREGEKREGEEGGKERREENEHNLTSHRCGSEYC